jgi:uncharacterized protein YxeA
MKKIILAVVAILVIGVGALFAINGKSNYDPTKYSLKVTPQDKPFGVGSMLNFKLPDQFSKPHQLTSDIKKVMFVFTKATGHIFKSFMADKNRDFLEKRGLMIVADVSGMPTVILNTFAMPDFQKSNYPVLLIYDKNMAKRLKEGKDASKVVLITLKNNEVTKVEYAKDTNELAALLK